MSSLARLFTGKKEKEGKEGKGRWVRKETKETEEVHVGRTELTNATVEDGRRAGTMSYGYHLELGRRADMEDAVILRVSEDEKNNSSGIVRGRDDGNEPLTYSRMCQVQRDTFGTEKASFFAVLDGHGGAAVVEKVKESLVQNVVNSSHFQNGTDMEAAIVEGFRVTDEQVIADATSSQFCGSTAAMVVVVGNKIYLAHIGDTRIVLSCNNGEMLVTKDHKANREDEKKRIEELGGTVLFFGTWRVEGMLAVTRSFGDGVLKSLIPAIPEVEVREVSPSNMPIAIIATDGVWDVISNQEAMQTVQEASNPKEAAKALVREAFEKGSTDNISVIVVEFNT